MIRKILRGLVLAAFAASLVACNTVKGVGKDLQKAGEKLEDSAEKHS